MGWRAELDRLLMALSSEAGKDVTVAACAGSVCLPAHTGCLARPTVNRRIVLDARRRGAPTAADLRLKDPPVSRPEDGPVLLRMLFLPLDPCMRRRMSDGPSYAVPVAIETC